MGEISPGGQCYRSLRPLLQGMAQGDEQVADLGWVADVLHGGAFGIPLRFSGREGGASIEQ
jgi:hypothetical protein